MKRAIAWFLAGALCMLYGTAFAATPGEGEVCVPVPVFEVEVCGIPDEPPPTTTTTTLPPTTTTTVPPTTTTTVPPTTTTTEPPFVPDQCVVDQVAREDGPFDIFTANVDTGTQWFTVEYDNDLGNGFGWISGDKQGYQGAYMFLVELATGRVVGRAFFARVDGAAYTKINDSGMNEIQTTHLGFDGTCATPAEDNQGQAPGAQEEYLPNSDPDERPVIEFVHDGQVIETRPYNLVNLLLPNETKFRQGDPSGPLEQVNGFGTDPHIVFDRQPVLLDVLIDGVWSPALVIYYDTLVSDVTLSTTLG